MCPSDLVARLWARRGRRGARAQIIHNQVYLAAPADCPLHPDGSRRNGPGGARAHSRTVELLVSDDAGVNFQETCVPIKWLDLVSGAPKGPLRA